MNANHVILTLVLVLSVNQILCDTTTKCSLPTELLEEIASYKDIVDKIINFTTSGEFKGKTYKGLADFVDKFGPRFTGTDNLEKSIDYMLDLAKSYNLDNVHGEDVTVPVWKRGKESASLLEPRQKTLSIIGLGGSVSTPKEGITAEAFVITSFEDLNNQTISQNVKGKILVVMPTFTTYQTTVKYRAISASLASSHGAVACLIRSMTPFSMYIPHTGVQMYNESITKIPAAAITVEDGNMLLRMQNKNQAIKINLKMEASNGEPRTSRNVIAEIKGKSKPEKVVIISGHVDSWDVGEGAMDDGGGCFISWGALMVLKKLNLKPKRTVRSILWTAEEMGLIGARQYGVQHKNESDNIIIALESDYGTFNPQGLEYHAGIKGGCILEEIMKLMAPINATWAKNMHRPVGSDIQVLQDLGIPGGSFMNANEKYFWYHHSVADTIDVENTEELDRGTAFWAALSYILADIGVDFPRN